MIIKWTYTQYTIQKEDELSSTEDMENAKKKKPIVERIRRSTNRTNTGPILPWIIPKTEYTNKGIVQKNP